MSKAHRKTNSLAEKGNRLRKTLAMTATCLASIASIHAQPLHLDLGLELIGQIQAHALNGVFTDADGIELNRKGGSWSSSSNQVFLRYEDAGLGTLPGAYAKNSSLVSLLLKEAYQWDWKPYEFYDPIDEEFDTTSSPACYRYAALIQQGIGFDAQIIRVDAIQPGDIMTMVKVNDDSGHMGIVAGINLADGMPYHEDQPDSDPTFFGTTLYPLQLLDSTSNDHSFDTRTFEIGGQEIETEGIGVGTIGVLANANYEFLGYTWSLPTSNYHTKPNSWVKSVHSRIKWMSERVITVGRLAGAMPPPVADPVDPTPDPEPDPTPNPEPEPPVADPTPTTTPDIQIVNGVPTISGPLHLTQGLELVSGIIFHQDNDTLTNANGIEINRYGGSWNSSTNPCYLQFEDTATGDLPEVYAKCSSFVTLLLKSAYGWNWKDYDFFDPLLQQVVSKSSPHSYRYAALIKQLVGFEQQITRLDQAQAGDIMAAHDVGTDTGHTMMFLSIDWNGGIPYPENLAASDSTLFGTTYYPVDVIDVSSGGHSFDTRDYLVDGVEVETSGAGVGTMGFLLDANSEIVGHTWSLPSSNPITKPNSWLNSLHNRLKRQTDRELVIGRIPAQP